MLNKEGVQKTYRCKLIVETILGKVEGCACYIVLYEHRIYTNLYL